jgi:hypothetical protein
MRRLHLAVVALGIVLMAGVAAQQRAEKSNMELIGSNDLQGRSAYQPVIHKQGSRWIAYIGHHGGMAINPLTGKRCVGTGADERCKVAIQTNNVEVDDRGYIYIVDRANTGLHVLELTGAARKAANFP